SARKTQLRKTIHFLSRNFIFARGFLRRVTHRHVSRRIKQRLPQEILELHLPHLESAAMRVCRNRISTHRFGPNAKSKLNLLQSNRIGGLPDRLNSSSANALHQNRRPIDRHPRIKTDVSRQQVSIETSLRHASSNHG